MERNNENMSLKEQIQRDQMVALKNKETEKLSVLRMMWSAVRNAEIDARREALDDDVVSVIRRQVKQSEDALLDFQKGGRDDLVRKTEHELALLRSYLPTEMSDEALRALVSKIIGEMGHPDASQFGRVMGAVMKEARGEASGERVKKIVTDFLPEKK